jgi:hypothetical protein
MERQTITIQVKLDDDKVPSKFNGMQQGSTVEHTHTGKGTDGGILGR